MDHFLMFGVEVKVVRAVFIPKPFPGSPRIRLGPGFPSLYSFVARSGLKFGSLGPFLERKPRKTSLAFHAIFNGFYLKNKAGLTGNFVPMKNSYKRREQLCELHSPVVQGVDNAIHRINHCLRRSPTVRRQAFPNRLRSGYEINHYPVDSIVCFVSTYHCNFILYKHINIHTLILSFCFVLFFHFSFLFFLYLNF